MKASPGARSWMAAGVRHELLTRALPALRHEMAAPVSVIRMSILLLKRQVGDPAVAAASLAERANLIDEQVTALAGAIRSLRDWELATPDEGITRSALVAQCATLMRVAFDLQGVGLRLDGGLAARPDEPRFPAGAALRYMVLGALGYLHDSVPDIGEIGVEPDGERGLRFKAGPGSSTPTDPITGAAHRAPRALAIDAVALQSLADGLGYEVAVDGAEVRFALDAAT